MWNKISNKFNKAMTHEFYIARYKGKPIYLHALMSLALLYFTFRYGLIDGSIMLVCYVILMLAHELGHAFYVSKYNYQLIEIKLSPIHGQCDYRYNPNFPVHPLVHAGGLIAQAGILILFSFLYLILDLSNSNNALYYLSPVFYIFLKLNLFTMILNLLPIEGLDGKEIWPHISSYFKSKKSNHNRSNTKKSQNASIEASKKVVDLAIVRAQKKRKKHTEKN